MKKMVRVVLTASMMASCIAVPFTASATETAPDQTTLVENNDTALEDAGFHKPFISVEDILLLSQKGDELTWDDFEKYNYIDKSSGTSQNEAYKWELSIKDNSSKLAIGGSSLQEKPEYITYVVGNGAGFDIRIENLEWLLYGDWSFIIDDQNTVLGDSNCDGSVDMADAVMIMQALANPNKYGLEGTAEHHLTEQGKINGDMDGDGLTVGDAQMIQLRLLGLEVLDSQGNDNHQLTSIQYESFSRDYPYYNTVSDLANKANQVFSGTVKNISFELLEIRTMQPVKADEDSQRTMICTIYEIEAEEVYAGTPTIVKLRIEGGIPSSFEQEQITLLGSDTIPVMEGAPVLEVGANYLFALYNADGSEYSSILNPMQSIYTEDNVNTDGVSGSDIISYFS